MNEVKMIVWSSYVNCVGWYHPTYSIRSHLSYFLLYKAHCHSNKPMLNVRFSSLNVYIISFHMLN